MEEARRACSVLHQGWRTQALSIALRMDGRFGWSGDGQRHKGMLGSGLFQLFSMALEEKDMKI